MKKIYGILALGVISWVGWYFFLKPHDFKIHFKAKALPGTINQTVKLWARSLQHSVVNAVKTSSSIDKLQQRIDIDGKTYHYIWNMQMLDDSTSQVVVQVKEPNNQLINRLTIPFFKTAIEISSKEMIKDFYQILNQHLGNIKITIEGVNEIRNLFCVCTSLKTNQLDKARGMMNNYLLLSDFVAENGLKTDGVPLVQVVSWDQQTDSIAYNFCYPIKKQDTLPAHHSLFYQKIANQKALKAIYNGNYITSDRAWYLLLRYADKHKLKVLEQPVEFFYNNPNLGGNEMKWKTEVFLPIK